VEKKLKGFGFLVSLIAFSLAILCKTGGRVHLKSLLTQMRKAYPAANTEGRAKLREEKQKTKQNKKNQIFWLLDQVYFTLAFKEMGSTKKLDTKAFFSLLYKLLLSVINERNFYMPCFLFQIRESRLQ